MLPSSVLRIFLSYMYGEMRTVFGCSLSNCPWHSFVSSVAQIIPIYHSCYPVDVQRIILVPSFSIRQYIFYCTSNLTGIPLVDYLVVVLVYSFDREFALDFSTTWRKYLPLFTWIHVLILDWCLESKAIYFRLVWSQFGVVFVVALITLFYRCILSLSFSKVAFCDHFQRISQ